MSVDVLDRSAARHKPAVLRLSKWLLKTLAPLAVVEIYLVGNRFMEKNVLAFPAPSSFPRPDLKGKKALGEIYLNPTYIRSHGEDLEYMLVHGFLHLLGYDHHKKSDRISMERKENELLTRYASDR